jgi:hypothetical protein
MSAGFDGRVAGALLMAAGYTACGFSASSAEPERTLSYRRDIAPLFLTDPGSGPSFGGRCASCHHSTSVTELDLTRPFDPEVGLVGVPSSLKGANGILRVAPGDVSRSYLIEKISRLDFDRETEGWPMPADIPRLSATESLAIRQWIDAGARNDAFYAAAVAPIFGDALSEQTSGKCSLCHYPGSPTLLDLTDPFDPEFGLVGVPTDWGREGGLRVVPGDPDESFLVDKVEREDLDPAEDGRPMPLHLPRLRPDQIEMVRVWIREGAHPD